MKDTTNAKGVPDSTSGDGKKRRTLLFDLGLILVLLLASLLAWVLLRPTEDEGVLVRVQIEGQEDEYYPLSRDGVYALNGGTNTLVIEDGWAWMSDASCPDQLCVYQGRIQKNGQWIICLPNRVAVTIEGGEDAAWDEILG